MLPSLFAQGNRRTVANLEALRRQAHADKAARVALRIQAIMLSIDEHSATRISEYFTFIELPSIRGSTPGTFIAKKGYGKDIAVADQPS